MMHIPIISNVYDLSKRFVAIVDRGGEDNLKSMRPVWCFFGGEGGAAVLGLMPSPEPVMVGEHKYVAVLVPSAPVPFGGALDQAGRRRRGTADERLCVHGRHAAGVEATRADAACADGASGDARACRRPHRTIAGGETRRAAKAEGTEAADAPKREQRRLANCVNNGG